MCGLAGALAVRGGQPDADIVAGMASCMVSRGPDDKGLYCCGPVALSFRRLAILDLSAAGHQPFLSTDGQLAIVFNGEIFNYVELRDELAQKGHVFRSGTDTEVLLAAYMTWGVDCLERLNGMWSFLIADMRRGLLFGARDRFGVKPMYRTYRDGTFYFASEIKALRRTQPEPSAINWPLAVQFLGRGRLDTLSAEGRTFFEDITEFPAAHAFTLTFDGQERRWRYWSVPEGDDPGVDAVERVRQLLFDSVRLRLRSDVPLGVALSGGMDSSSIIALMSRILAAGDSTAGLHAFTYAPAEKSLSEERYIKDTVQLTGATLHTTSPSPLALWETLPTVLAAHDEPLHSPTALVGYQVYRLASQAGIRVVLGGQGADETLGGYPSYFSDAWLDELRSGQLVGLWRDLADYSAGHDVSLQSLLFPLLRRFAAVALPRPRRSTAAPLPYGSWLSSEARGLAIQHTRRQGQHSLHAELAQSTTQHPLPLFLRVEDRNSMAHSIEARLPFMDYRLVEQAFRLRNNWKIRGRWNKYVLRQAMQGTIPESVRTRIDKMGFPTAFSEWIRGPLQAKMADRIYDASLDRMPILDPSAIRAAFKSHLDGDADHGVALFHVVQFVEWHDSIIGSGSQRT